MAIPITMMSLAAVRRAFPAHSLRAPHYTASTHGMVGAFSRRDDHSFRFTPGELHLGTVLFLEDLPEFRIATLEKVGAALQRGSTVSIIGDGTALHVPIRIQRVFYSMAPCPCGMRGEPAPAPRCSCTDSLMARWDKRVKRALRDLTGSLAVKP